MVIPRALDDQPRIIKGKRHIDSRGSIAFVNDFDMSLIKRFYSIQPEEGLPRAWQGHKLESKWFHAIKGRFRVKLRSLETYELLGDYELNDAQPEILHVPMGMYNGFESLEKGSLLLVFSDSSLEQSKSDDFRADLTDIPWE